MAGSIVSGGVGPWLGELCLAEVVQGDFIVDVTVSSSIHDPISNYKKT